VRRACADLAAAGATVLNQSVLLAGVNDSVEALADLSEFLFAARVLPYYLHLRTRYKGPPTSTSTSAARSACTGP
jgi:L-lysine 2,3-aminomutase